MRRSLPLLTAVALALGALNAHRLPPRSQWGDVYAHVPNHLVTAGAALLVAAALLALARDHQRPRAQRALVRLGRAWGLVSLVFVVDAVGGGLGDRSGDDRLHDAAMVLLPVAGLLLLVATVLLLLSRCGWVTAAAALASAPGTLALNEASSGLWLVTGLVAAAAWAAVAVRDVRPAAPVTTRVAAPVA